MTAGRVKNVKNISIFAGEKEKEKKKGKKGFGREKEKRKKKKEGPREFEVEGLLEEENK
jgi:hypothetical protein